MHVRTVRMLVLKVISVCVAFVDCQRIWWQVSWASCLQQPRQCSHFSWQLHCCCRVLSV